MKQKTIYIFLFLLVHFTYHVKSQDVADSLENVLTLSNEDTGKVKILNALFLEYEFKDTTKAFDYLNNALKLSQKLKYNRGIADAYLYLGFFAEDKGNYTEALNYYTKSLNLRKKINDKKGQASTYNNLGIAFYSLGNYPEALKNYLLSLRIRENTKDTNGIAASSINIGLIYYRQGNYKEGIKYFKESLNNYRLIGNTHGIAYSYNYIGLIYYAQKKFDEAIENENKSLALRKEINDKKGIAECYNNLGGAYSAIGDNEEALKNYFSSIKIKKEIGDKRGIANSYANIGIVYLNEKKFNKAKEYLEKSKDILLLMGAKENLKGCYEALSSLDSAKGDFKMAYKNYKIFVKYKDSIDNEESRRKIVQTRMSYEFEKKEAVAQAEYKKEIENQKALSKEKSRKQNMILMFVIAGLFVVLIFTLFIYRSLKLTKKQKATIEKQKIIVDEKNLQLEQSNDEITAQRDEIAAQRDLVTDQKKYIEEQKKEIDDSIRYAKRIQQAVMPKLNLTEDKKGFVLFKPKDVVSGDFYWTTNIKDWTIITVADCTGHGVPGAFMSMLGISFLNEIVRKEEVTDTAEILNHLRHSIIDALKQTGEEGSQKDGMDMSIIAIHQDRKKAMWSGANNPLYLLRDHEIQEIKGDKMPVAVHTRMESFTNHEITLKPNDKLYLFSDGFPDQFGGQKGKKFKYVAFKNLLTETCDIPMKEQGIQMEKTLHEWMNFNGQEYEQIDDITVLGIKI